MSVPIVLRVIPFYTNRIYSLVPEGKKIGLKNSLNQVGLCVINKLKKENPDHIILGTAIYSADQAILGHLHNAIIWLLMLTCQHMELILMKQLRRHVLLLTPEN